MCLSFSFFTVWNLNSIYKTCNLSVINLILEQSSKWIFVLFCMILYQKINTAHTYSHIHHVSFSASRVTYCTTRYALHHASRIASRPTHCIASRILRHMCVASPHTPMRAWKQHLCLRVRLTHIETCIKCYASVQMRNIL